MCQTHGLGCSDAEVRRVCGVPRAQMWSRGRGGGVGVFQGMRRSYPDQGAGQSVQGCAGKAQREAGSRTGGSLRTRVIGAGEAGGGAGRVHLSTKSACPA